MKGKNEIPYTYIENIAFSVMPQIAAAIARTKITCPKKT